MNVSLGNKKPTSVTVLTGQIETFRFSSATTIRSALAVSFSLSLSLSFVFRGSRARFDEK